MNKALFFCLAFAVNINSLLCLNNDDDDDGFYHPEKYIGPDGDDGHYVHDDSGQYIHDDSGKYRHENSGIYRDSTLGPFKSRYEAFKNRQKFNLNEFDRPFPKKGSGFFSKKLRNHMERTDRPINFDAEPVTTTGFPPDLRHHDRPQHNHQQFALNKFVPDADDCNDCFHPRDKDRAATHSALRYNPGRIAQQYRPREYNQDRYDDSRWRILKQDTDVQEDGYHWDFETENGIAAEESGKVANKAMKARGSYVYTGPDNKVYKVTYTADENGFNAQGNHLPTPPPIPEAILKSLELTSRSGNKF